MTKTVIEQLKNLLNTKEQTIDIAHFKMWINIAIEEIDRLQSPVDAIEGSNKDKLEKIVSILNDPKSNHLHDTLSQAVQEYIIEVETLLQRTDGGERLKAVYDAMNENDAITAKNAILSLQKKGR